MNEHLNSLADQANLTTIENCYQIVCDDFQKLESKYNKLQNDFARVVEGKTMSSRFDVEAYMPKGTDFNANDKPVTLADRLDDLMPSVGDMAAMIYRIGKEFQERPKKPVDSGWLVLDENNPPKIFRDDLELILGQCTETGRRFYRIRDKDLAASNPL